MAKSKIPPNLPLEKGKILKEVQEKAKILLTSIADSNGVMEKLRAEYEAKIAQINAELKEKLLPVIGALQADEKAIIALMKKNKTILFDETDVVHLPPGSLIRTAGDKVTIPRNALQSCKDNGFQDVIKIAESLDREAIEKWPDTKLILIGATRKPSEEFKYDLKLREN
jgi:hypothetical protein